VREKRESDEKTRTNIPTNGPTSPLPQQCGNRSSPADTHAPARIVRSRIIRVRVWSDRVRARRCVCATCTLRADGHVWRILAVQAALALA